MRILSAPEAQNNYETLPLLQKLATHLTAVICSPSSCSAPYPTQLHIARTEDDVPPAGSSPLWLSLKRVCSEVAQRSPLMCKEL